MSDTVNMPDARPARKVVGATGGAAVGLVSSQLVVWGLDEYVFEPDVVNSVPGPVEAFVLLIVPLALTFVGGYFTKRGKHELR